MPPKLRGLAPRSDPAKSQALRLSASPLGLRSAAVFVRQVQPSPRKGAKPLQRWSTRFKAEGIGLPLPTLADQVGHGTFAQKPAFDLIESDVLVDERLYGDDTAVSILARGKCDRADLDLCACAPQNLFQSEFVHANTTGALECLMDGKLRELDRCGQYQG